MGVGVDGDGDGEGVEPFTCLRAMEVAEDGAEGKFTFPTRDDPRPFDWMEGPRAGVEGEEDEPPDASLRGGGGRGGEAAE